MTGEMMEKGGSMGPSGKGSETKIQLRGVEESTQPTFEVNYASGATGTDLKLQVLRKNPMVPIGAGVTAGILLAGLFAFKNGSQIWSQRLMRMRVLAQGATLVVLAGAAGAGAGGGGGTKTMDRSV